MSEDQKDSSHFNVWLTCRADSHVPDILLQNVHKISWNHVISLSKVNVTNKPRMGQLYVSIYCGLGFMSHQKDRDARPSAYV